MRSAAVYSCLRRSNSVDKEALIYAQVAAALAGLANLQHYGVGTGDSAAVGAKTIPGLLHIRGSDPVIALGHAAHVALADFQKRTLIVDDLDLDGEGDLEDIEQLLWSCVNTTRVVALGESAWHSIQLLPIGNRRFYNLPPLCLGPARGAPAEARVLVINHDLDDAWAKSLADVLDRCGMMVECAGLSTGSIGPGRNGGWSDDAFIHVHVGEHTLSAHEPRLVDSWRSDRIALQLTSRHRSRSAPNPSALMIEDEANGFICETADEVVTACRELLEDRVLQRKMIAAGQNSVAPLVKTWFSVADDLLA